MTTQTTPPTDEGTRLGQLEGAYDQVGKRLDDLSRGQIALDAKIDILRAESHAENQATNDKIDTKIESLRTETLAKIDTLRAENRADYQALDAKIDTLRAENRADYQALRAENTQIRSDINRQTYLLIGAMGAFTALFAAIMALFAFLG